MQNKTKQPGTVQSARKNLEEMNIVKRTEELEINKNIIEMSDGTEETLRELRILLIPPMVVH